MNKYEIWLGYYHLGQGYDPPNEPKKIAEIKATSFRIACVIYEHQSSIDGLKKQMECGHPYIEDIHFGKWNYNPKTNSNCFTGRYYESEKQAKESFEK